MLLPKMSMSLMLLIKQWLLVISIAFLSLSATADILYHTEDEKTHAYFTQTLDEIADGIKIHDLKAIYLSALHEFEDNSDKSVSIKILQELASRNISDAKYSLYFISKQIEIAGLSKQEGLRYLIEAAEDNYAPAQKKLAILYLYGSDGIEKNAEKYHYWQKRAAQLGDGEAMISLARSYFAGKGTPEDDTQGFKWVVKALETQKSLFHNWDMLATLYEQGIGTPVDLVKAYMCYDMEGTAGIDEKARIGPRMTEAQRAEGLRLSRQWQEDNDSYTFPALGLEYQKDGSYRRR